MADGPVKVPCRSPKGVTRQADVVQESLSWYWQGRRAATTESPPRPVSSVSARTKSLLLQGRPQKSARPLGTGGTLQQLGEGSVAVSTNTALPISSNHPQKKRREGLLVRERATELAGGPCGAPGWGACFLSEGLQEHMPAQQGMQSSNRNTPRRPQPLPSVTGPA